MTESTGSHTFNIFAYGSLLFAPELPDRVLNTLPARLYDYRRSFCKISRSRSCPRRDSFDAFDLPPRFRDDDHNRSLALGTVADPGAWIDGAILTYPKAIRADLITLLDRREGYSPIHTIANGYIRRRHLVSLLRSGEEAESIVYFWDDDPSGANYISDDVSLLQRAKILINATPKTPDASTDPLARGLYYMEGVRRALTLYKLLDPHLEALAQTIHTLPGPWISLVSPPHTP